MIIELILVGIILSSGFSLWFVLLPFILIDIISNKRCYNRQNKLLIEIEFYQNEIVCTDLRGEIIKIPFAKARFSIREVKFEKEKTEIELKIQKSLKNKLIGRLKIKNWNNLLEIKQELVHNSIIEVRFRPEGYWSKYGVLTADAIITSTAMVGVVTGESDVLNSDLIMPITDIKENLKSNQEGVDHTS